MNEELEAWVESFKPATELRKMEFKDEDWLIKDMLVKGSYMVVYGKEGAGKSRLVYQLANCFQTGEPWFGLEIGQTGTVLYLEMDMSPLESNVLVRDAYEVGFTQDQNIIFPQKRGVIDVLKATDVVALEALRERFDPLIVIVDTLTDVYESRGAKEDINAEIRKAIEPFRTVFDDSGNIFMLHERRKGQYLIAKEIKDTDAMLGGGETARKASSVIQIVKTNEVMREIIIHKSRQKKPFTELRVFTSPEAKGFCRVNAAYVKTPKQALALWPRIVGMDPKLVNEATSLNSVYRSIQDCSGGALKFDAIKKAYQRAKNDNVEFYWERLLSGDNAQSGDI